MAITNSRRVELVECPRDAMQGWKSFIPTEKKIAYLNTLLRVGFHTLDCGSFVSPKAIPQMADTSEVLKRVPTENSKTKLLVIVANQRGAEEAVGFDNISCLGFPFSISPAFQMRNAHNTIEENEKRLELIQNLCIKHSKELVVYLSMAFGNPFGDEYDEELLLDWADEMVKKNIKVISLADTVGIATPDQISFALTTLIAAFPQVDFGVHLHSTGLNWENKLAAAIQSGCKRFDGALKGIGGCPMAGDELVGNMDTGSMITYFQQAGILGSLNSEALEQALQQTREIFV